MKLSPKADLRDGRIARWGTYLILLISFAVRLFRLGDANLWWDEALAVWAVRKGFCRVTMWTAGDVHPPLYFWSLWAWVQLVGESEFAMRALSVGFGVLTVAVVHSLGSLIGGRAVGLLAALFTGLSRFHVWWSQEMRMYVLAGLLGVLSLYFFLRWLRSERIDPLTTHHPEKLSPTLLLAFYSLASACSLYTIFLMASIVLIENIVVFVVLVWPRGYRRKAILLKWGIAQTAILIALGAWLLLSWGRMRTWSVISEPVGLRFFMRLYATLLTTGISVGIEGYVWSIVLPFAALALGGLCLIVDWRRHRYAFKTGILDALTLVLAFALSAALIYLASIPRGLFYSPRIEARYFLPFAPAFWLLLAWSIVLIGERWRRVGWACAAIILALWVILLPQYYSDRYLRDELQTMVRAIISQAERGDAVILDSGGRYPIFLYYYDRFPDTVWRPPVLTVSKSETPLIKDQVNTKLGSIANEYQRIWLAEVDVKLTDPKQLVGRWLSEGHKNVFMQRYGHNTLYLFDPQGRSPSLTANGYVPQFPLDAPVGTGGRLAGWELPVQTFTPGSMIHLSLLWERTPDEPAEIALRNAEGKLLLQRRAELPTAREQQRQQLDFPVYPSTPAGQYDIVLSPPLPSGSPLGTLDIADTAPLPRVGAGPDTPVNARLGPDIILEGYTLYSSGGKELDGLAPGGRFVLDLYWCAQSKLERDYTVFTHLLGQAHNPKTQGPVWGQHDSQPANNGYPTTQWFQGDIVVDRHVIIVDEGAPEGVYRIEVGMYTPGDGKRLPVVSKDGQALGDHVLLDTPVHVRIP